MYKELKKYFTVKELVSQRVYDKHGEDAWRLLDPRMLEVLLWVRTTLDKKIFINNWHNGGAFSQRGYRENLSEIVRHKTNRGVLYTSAHTLGMAVDFSVGGMKAEDVRKWLKENKDDIPYNIRLELNVNWVHLDISTLPHYPKITYF